MSEATSAILVVFGASGDLASRKLLPALFELYRARLLAPEFAVLGIGRTELSTEAFRDKAIKSIESTTNEASFPADLDEFAQKLHYCSLNTTSVTAYSVLPNALRQIAEQNNIIPNYLYYLATPPALHQTIAEGLAAYGLAEECSNGGWRRLIVEKPFGHDLNSAKELNTLLLRYFAEEQIYRIDHYLGKETVQNILVTRLANSIFEPLWNRQHIHHVEITCAETIGLENRAGYYDKVGALNDMIQNHMLQLLGFMAIDPPTSLDGETIRKEMLKTFQSVRVPTGDEIARNVVRGQYSRGKIQEQSVCGYLEESGVSNNSTTETYVAAKLFLDSDRWQGVPFFLRTGKRLSAKVSEVAIHFKPSCHSTLNKRVASSQVSNRVVCDSCNQLIFRIQPNEGILLRFGMKAPGGGFTAQSVDMDFSYSSLDRIHLQGAYERLLADCLVGDTILFPRGEAIIRCWEIVDPIRKFWDSEKEKGLFYYPAGSWGPSEAEQLVDDVEMMWRYPRPELDGRIN